MLVTPPPPPPASSVELSSLLGTDEDVSPRCFFSILWPRTSRSSDPRRDFFSSLIVFLLPRAASFVASAPLRRLPARARECAPA